MCVVFSHPNILRWKYFHLVINEWQVQDICGVNLWRTILPFVTPDTSTPFSDWQTKHTIFGQIGKLGIWQLNGIGFPCMAIWGSGVRVFLQNKPGDCKGTHLSDTRGTFYISVFYWSSHRKCYVLEACGKADYLATQSLTWDDGFKQMYSFLIDLFNSFPQSNHRYNKVLINEHANMCDSYFQPDVCQWLIKQHMIGARAIIIMLDIHHSD